MFYYSISVRDIVRDNLDKYSPINAPFYTKDTYLKRENQNDHNIDSQVGGWAINHLNLKFCDGTLVGVQYHGTLPKSPIVHSVLENNPHPLPNFDIT